MEFLNRVSVLGLKEFAKKCGSVFAELAIVGAKGSQEMRVDVEFARNFVVKKNRDDNLGFGLDRASEITRVGGNVIDDNGSACGRGGSADALIEGDACVRRHGAPEGAKDKHVAVRFFFEHVEANPIVACELFVKHGNDALHEVAGRSGFRGERVQL